MSLAAVIVNPSLMIRDYKTEYIVYFLPVLEQELIRIICFKNFETYILSCQFRNIKYFEESNWRSNESILMGQVSFSL